MRKIFIVALFWNILGIQVSFALIPKCSTLLSQMDWHEDYSLKLRVVSKNPYTRITMISPTKSEDSDRASRLVTLNSLYPRALDKIRSASLRVVPKDFVATTVFYPFSGTDVGVVRAFPKANRYILASTTAFLNRRTHAILQQSSIPLEQNVGTFSSDHIGYRDTVAFKSDSAIAIELIAALITNIPDVRIREVSTFSKEDPIFGMYSRKASHGIIRFDRGKGTPLQEIIHLNIRIEEGRGTPWWVATLNSFSPNVLFIKANDAGLSSSRSMIQSIMNHSSQPWLLAESVRQGVGEFSGKKGELIIDFDERIKVGYENSFQFIMFH